MSAGAIAMIDYKTGDRSSDYKTIDRPSELLERAIDLF
jgi:hypothetical protein